MKLDTIGSVGIIGAGEAGLAAAKMLLAEGYRCTIFERNARVGGVWTTGYLGFGVQVQRELYEIPDWPLPADGPDFTPGPTVCSYLEAYSDRFGVTPHVRLNTTVTGVEERSDGAPGWTVSYLGPDGREQCQAFDLVVVATGLYSHTPNMPEFSGQDRFRGRIIHNSELQSREQLEGRKVAVVGYGKSATDAAVLAAESAEESTIVFREQHWPVPAVLPGGIPFKYALFNRLTNAMLPLHSHASAFERAWHRVGKPFIWAFWRLIEQIIIHHCGLHRPRKGKSATTTDLIPPHRIEYDGFSNSTMLPKPEFFAEIHAGRLGAEQAVITSYDEKGILLSNGRRLDCDLVVMATGWRNDYGFLSEEIRRRKLFQRPHRRQLLSACLHGGKRQEPHTGQVACDRARRALCLLRPLPAAARRGLGARVGDRHRRFRRASCRRRSRGIARRASGWHHSPPQPRQPPRQPRLGGRGQGPTRRTEAL